MDLMSDSLPAREKQNIWVFLTDGYHGLHPLSLSGGKEQVSVPSRAINPVFFEPT